MMPNYLQLVYSLLLKRGLQTDEAIMKLKSWAAPISHGIAGENTVIRNILNNAELFLETYRAKP